MFSKLIRKPKVTKPASRQVEDDGPAGAMVLSTCNRCCIDHWAKDCPSKQAAAGQTFAAVPFRKVTPAEFKRKLALCSVVYNFPGSSPDSSEKKQIKMRTLVELKHYVSREGIGQLNEAMLKDMFRMISVNLCRLSPRKRLDSLTGLYFQVDEDNPAWMHMEHIYELLLCILTCRETDGKTAEKYVNQSFVTLLLDLFDSQDPRERKYVQKIVDRMYLDFVVLRPFIRGAIDEILYGSIFRIEMHNGIVEMLEVLGCIIKRFKFPLRKEHNQFLVRTVIPLHKPRYLNMYHQQLTYCIVRFVEKDLRLADTVIRGLLEHWPTTNSQKEVIMLGEVKEVLEIAQLAEFQRFMVPLFQQICRSLNSQHSQVAEHALMLWDSDYILALIKQNCIVILPLIFSALEKNLASSVSRSVHNLTLIVWNKFQEMDTKLFNKCLHDYEDKESKLKIMQEEGDAEAAAVNASTVNLAKRSDSYAKEARKGEQAVAEAQIAKLEIAKQARAVEIVGLAKEEEARRPNDAEDCANQSGSTSQDVATALQQANMKCRRFDFEELKIATNRFSAKEEARKGEQAVAEAQLAKLEIAEQARAIEIVGLAKEEEAGRPDNAEDCTKQSGSTNQDVATALQQAKMKYRRFDFEELKIATNGFSEENKLGRGGYGYVYKGKLHHIQVAIKVLDKHSVQGSKEFQREVQFLSHMHHPHIVLLLGACPEQGCLVYEYLANGSLEDCLRHEGDTAPLPWPTRFQIAVEVATALLFLHSLVPEPYVHRDLKPGNILLDQNYSSKLGDVGLAALATWAISYDVTDYRETRIVGTPAYIDPAYLDTGYFTPRSDVYAFGVILLQLLTGEGPFGLRKKVENAVNGKTLEDILDSTAGNWPVHEATELACIAIQCSKLEPRDRLDIQAILPQLESLATFAKDYIARMARSLPEAAFNIPSTFLCPISKEIMENPHFAADGFTYEFAAIKGWLEDHKVSPNTQIKLKHKDLIPNHNLRLQISEWKRQLPHAC